MWKCRESCPRTNVLTDLNMLLSVLVKIIDVHLLTISVGASMLQFVSTCKERYSQQHKSLNSFQQFRQFSKVLIVFKSLNSFQKSYQFSKVFTVFNSFYIFQKSWQISKVLTICFHKSWQFVFKSLDSFQESWQFPKCQDLSLILVKTRIRWWILSRSAALSPPFCALRPSLPVGVESYFQD